jgi:hypothetical protein
MKKGTGDGLKAKGKRPLTIFANNPNNGGKATKWQTVTLTNMLAV